LQGSEPSLAGLGIANRFTRASDHRGAPAKDVPRNATRALSARHPFLAGHHSAIDALRMIREKGVSYEYHYVDKARATLVAFNSELP
jgi:hypothetical protein